jgi:alkanesulfonate monooxygenase SsuD/methylene tetrahydromethanopterin reductase-like flavin-dependent oxidoreductase (luciferase family)
MRLGVVLPVINSEGKTLRGQQFADQAALVEELGYDSIWAFDSAGRGYMLPDPMMILTVAATVTKRVELGVGVLQLPIRSPADTAVRAFTLQQVSSHRFVLGVGAGSTKADFDAFGADFEHRFESFEKCLATLRDLLQFGRSNGTDLTPWRSVLGGPPVLLAGWRGPWIERAAMEASGWIASARHADDATLASGIERFRTAGGRRAVVTNVSCDGEPSEVVARLRRLADMGFDDAVVFAPRPDADRYRAIREAMQ